MAPLPLPRRRSLEIPVERTLLPVDNPPAPHGHPALRGHSDFMDLRFPAAAPGRSLDGRASGSRGRPQRARPGRRPALRPPAGPATRRGPAPPPLMALPRRRRSRKRRRPSPASRWGRAPSPPPTNRRWCSRTSGCGSSSATAARRSFPPGSRPTSTPRRAARPGARPWQDPYPLGDPGRRRPLKALNEAQLHHRGKDRRRGQDRHPAPPERTRVSPKSPSASIPTASSRSASRPAAWASGACSSALASKT